MAMNGTRWIGRHGMLVLAMITLIPVPVEAQTVERIRTYAVAGTSGMELYQSIGEKGPEVGSARAIAHTTFDLKWSRKYRTQGDTCTLVSARPSLIIIYTVPKPSEKLPAAIRKDWDIFVEGLLRHEKVHGDTIREMVKTIEGFSVGMSVTGDPNCSKIRKELTKRLAAVSLAQRQQGRDFDRREFHEGGNMQRLILALVNGRR